MLDTQIVEKRKTHFLFKNNILKDCVIYEITWKTKEELRGHT